MKTYEQEVGKGNSHAAVAPFINEFLLNYQRRLTEAFHSFPLCTIVTEPKVDEGNKAISHQCIFPVVSVPRPVT